MFGLTPFLCLIIGVLTLPGFNAFVKWNSLKATWCPRGNSDADHCLRNIPRTVESGLKSGWRKVKGSSCHNDGKFYGHRMVKDDDYAITPLYDNNGIIAGVQVNMMRSELLANPSPYRYDDVPDYLDNTIERKRIYSLTTYFVDPTEICNDGRSLRQLEIEGTGSRLYFQTGKNPKNLRNIPLYRNAAVKNGYTSTNCVPTMGHHNHYEVLKMHLSNCTKIIPSFLLYNNNGELHGFGQTNVAKLSSLSFEHPNGNATRVTLDPITPECMIDMADSPSSPGYSNTHFFFTDAPRDIKCAPINQTEVTCNSIYINPNAFYKH